MTRIRLFTMLVAVFFFATGAKTQVTTPQFEMLVWVDGAWTVLDHDGEVLRTLSIAPNEPPGFPSLSDDGRKLVFLQRNWQTWEHDFATGQSRFLFQTDWNAASQWLPGSDRYITFGNYTGKIFLYDSLTGSTSLWQSNDVVGGRALGRLTFDSSMQSALVNIHYPGAGGMGVFQAEVCHQDATHALCNIRPLAWPGGGSGSWSDIAGGSVLTTDGTIAAYFERRHWTEGRIYVHNRVTNTRTALLHWTGIFDVGANVYGMVDDRYFVVSGQSKNIPGGSALYRCDITDSTCTEVATRPTRYAFGDVVLAHRIGGDNTAPVIHTPDDIIAEASSPAGATVTFSATADDDVDGPTPVSCEPASGNNFPIGTTTVTCTASDRAGNETTASFMVTVEDTVPPTIAVAAPSQAMLWPPNNKMVALTITVQASDATSEPLCAINSITGDDGATASDWALSPEPLSASLRATRRGPAGRTYLLTITCTDGSSNWSSVGVPVVVPHDKRKQ